MELETINKLYLELSQIATVRTAKELKAEERARKYGKLLEDVFNRDDVDIPVDLRQRISDAFMGV